jgi:hypothetical protein
VVLVENSEEAPLAEADRMTNIDLFAGFQEGEYQWLDI